MFYEFCLEIWSDYNAEYTKEIGIVWAESYTEAMKKIATDKELRVKYGRAGKKRIEENFLDSQFRENIRNVML